MVRVNTLVARMWRKRDHDPRLPTSRFGATERIHKTFARTAFPALLVPAVG